MENQLNLLTGLWTAALIVFAAAEWLKRHKAEQPQAEDDVDSSSTCSDEVAKYVRESADECISNYETHSVRTESSLRNQLILVVVALVAMSGSGGEKFKVLGTEAPHWAALALASIGLLANWFRIGWLLISVINFRHRATKLLIFLERRIASGDDSAFPKFASRYKSLVPSSAATAWLSTSLARSVPSESSESSEYSASAPFPWFHAMVFFHSLLFGVAHACSVAAATVLVFALAGDAETARALWASGASLFLVTVYWRTHYAFRFQAGIESRHHYMVFAAAAVFTHCTLHRIIPAC